MKSVDLLVTMQIQFWKSMDFMDIRGFPVDFINQKYVFQACHNSSDERPKRFSSAFLL